MVDLNYLYASILFYLVSKLVSFGVMYSKSKQILTSIPENDSEVDLAATKWVPKKKHEVLKAKYKCLKKLFQVYDASIGIMPETYGQGDGFPVEERDDRKSRKKKRFHRTRTDACAGTTDLTSELSEPIEHDDATADNSDLKVDNSNTMTAQSIDTKSNTTLESDCKNSTVFKKCCKHSCDYDCRCANASAVPFPQTAYYRGERRKPTRFQSFIQRLLGIRREPYRGVVLNGHVLAASDDDINQRYIEKRRRRGLRPYRRRRRRPKKAQSEGALRDSPLLDYAQAVQRNCLMDTTPRQCPIVGCRMMFYGIINYNDHLNLCHFTERRHVCHFCHEGFENEADKLHHESEHIGLSRLTPFLSTTARSVAVTSDTQTDPQPAGVPEEKLKKIVSFFDKIADSEQILADIKQNGCSESNIKRSSEEQSCASSFKRMSSCVDTCVPRAASNGFGVKCNFCGEKFEYRRQLSLHVDLEHRVHDKFSKFHSCAGMTNHQQTPGQLTSHHQTNHQQTTPGQLTITSSSGCPSVSRSSSATSTSCLGSSVASSIVGRLKGVNLHWEPGTKIVRV